MLKVTANGTVTSPVQARGLGAAQDRRPAARAAAAERAGHRARRPRDHDRSARCWPSTASNASCAACHAKIDPPGFALESFDVIGGWQTRYRSLERRATRWTSRRPARPQRCRTRWGQKVDAAGETADGRPFADIEEFKKLLLADPRAIARNLVGQLVVYATGAPVGFADRAAVEKMLDKTADEPIRHALVDPRDRAESVVSDEMRPASRWRLTTDSHDRSWRPLDDRDRS